MDLLDTLLTFPVAEAVLAGTLVLGSTLAYFFGPKRLWVAVLGSLPFVGWLFIWALNPFLIHAGGATDIERVGVVGGRLWATDVQRASDDPDRPSLTQVTWHTRYFILDPLTGERLGRGYLGMDVRFMGSSNNELIWLTQASDPLEGASELVTVDIVAGRETTRAPLTERLAAHTELAPGVAAIETSFRPHLLTVTNKRNESFQYDVIRNTISDGDAPAAVPFAPHISTGAVFFAEDGKERWTMYDDQLWRGEETLSPSRFVDGSLAAVSTDGSIVLVSHWDTTDHHTWRLSAFDRQGLLRWETDADALFPDRTIAPGEEVRVTIEDDTALLTLGGHLASLRATTGTLNFSRRI